ncbi:unnamed protein product [Symbiodinium sp. KB8]|nr:unnamed protein product [Symbiodinium sp. KB8]
MKKPPSDPPDWLPELHRQMDRKTFWGLVATKAPVEPAPNPLKLEKIFDEPDASQKEEFAHDVLCMAMVGKNTLRLAAAVAESARYLDRRDPQRMAVLIETGLIDLGTRKKMGTTREVCKMFYALMDLWDLGSAAKYKIMSLPAHDIWDVPGPYLRVRFEESDDGIYRWRQNITEEKRGGNVRKLVSIKHSIEQTPPYYFLHEEEQDETDEKVSVVMVTYLYVWYKTLQGEVYYRRSTKGGGLGEEYYQGKKYILSYSESKKTLVSITDVGRQHLLTPSCFKAEPVRLPSIGRRKQPEVETSGSEKSGKSALMVAECFGTPDESTLRLRFPGAQDAEPCELFGDVSVVCSFSQNLEERLFGDGKAEVFYDALPGEGLHMQQGDLPAWRRILAELHETPLRDLQGPVAAPPLCLQDIAVICFCAPTVADVRLRAPATSGVVWEFLCDGKALCDASPFFAAALRRNCWLEGRCQEVRFMEEDARTWLGSRALLLQLHGSAEERRFSAQLPVPGADTESGVTELIFAEIRLFALCKKYLLTRSEQLMLQRLREGSGLVPRLGALEEPDFMQIANQLQLHGVLPAVLGSWCLSYAASMARPLQMLLSAGGKLCQTVLDCAGAVAYIASGRFLCALRDSREPVSRILLLLAERGCLDLLQKCQRWDWLDSADDVWQVLTEDSLMPLTQLPAFRQELRQLRFCSPALAEALEPFPRLLDDLLDAWFGAGEGEVSLSLAGLELVSWAERCSRFRQNFLRAQLRELTPKAFASFSRTAALDQEEIGPLVQQHLQASLKSLCEAPLLRMSPPPDAPFAEFDGALLRRIWRFRLMGPFELGGALALVFVRPWFLPLRLTMLGLDLLRGLMSWSVPTYSLCRSRLAAESHCFCEAARVFRAVIAAAFDFET